MAVNLDQIVVRRHARRNNRSKPGGAWKVAFADFTLAMMSLFLVFWLMEVANPKERFKIAAHLRDYSIMDREANPFDIRNSPYPVDLEGNPALDDQVAPQYFPQGGAVADSDGAAGTGAGNGGSNSDYSALHAGYFDSEEQQRLLAQFIERLMQQLHATDNVQLELVPQGLRILIRDDDGHEMFARGSAYITPFFESVLLKLAPVFVRVHNSVMLSGHTDSASYPTDRYTNWELSGERALRARLVLEAGGMPKQRVAEVVAMADRMLADKADPQSGRNRRIELLILTRKAERELAALFDRGNAQSALSRALQEAEPAAAPREPL